MVTVVESPQRVAVRSTGGAVQRVLPEGAVGPVRDTSQAWFWNPTWQAGELEASRELREGRGRVFETAEDFLASLDD
jgi:hypothetical protein